MGKGLTKKDYEVLNEFANQLSIVKDGGLALKKAIMKVYDYKENDKYLAQKIAQRRKSLVKTQKYDELFALVGVDKPYIAAKLKQLMEAENPVVYRGKVSKDEKGNVVTVPDNRVQLQATALAANIVGLIQKGTSIDLSREQNNLIVFVEDEESARRTIEENLRKQSEIIKKSYKVEAEIGEEIASE
jgi:hypothetical protein